MYKPEHNLREPSGFGKSIEDILLCGFSVSYYPVSTGLLIGYSLGPRKPRRLYGLASKRGRFESE